MDNKKMQKKRFNIIEVPNSTRFGVEYKDLLLKYNSYIIKDLKDLKNKNNHSIYYIIEQGIYCVVTSQRITEFVATMNNKDE